MKLKIKIIALALSVTALISPKKESRQNISFEPVPVKNLNNAGISTVYGDKKGYVITDLTYQGKSNPFITDLVLSFNYPPEALRRDDIRRYRITYAGYIFAGDKGSLGEGCGKFFKKEHRVEIESSPNLWLGTCGDLGSFTLEFMFKPMSDKSGGEIFSRTGFLSGKKRGIEISLIDGRIHASLHDMFEKPDGTRTGIILKKGARLHVNKWHHFALTFDRISGKLVKFIDNEEEEAIYMSGSGKPFDGVFTPLFGNRGPNGEFSCIDAPASFIGRNYSGMIDEFRISYKKIEDLKNETDVATEKYRRLETIDRIPVNIEGVVTSPVYSFPGTGTKIRSFRWKEVIKKDTFIWMEMRIYDQLFYENDTDQRWYIIKNNQDNIFLKKDGKGEYIRGKYYQWRAHLVASPDGKQSPRLYDVSLEFVEDPPPGIPMFLEAASSGDRFVELTWKKNVEHDIRGYKIYYGVMPGKFDGVLSLAKGKRIDNSTTQGNFIKIRIDNALIDENRALDIRNLLTYPLLKNNVLYYFSVTSYDSYKPDTPDNHESELSKSVSARPFFGSEID